MAFCAPTSVLERSCSRFCWPGEGNSASGGRTDAPLQPSFTAATLSRPSTRCHPFATSCGHPSSGPATPASLSPSPGSFPTSRGSQLLPPPRHRPQPIGSQGFGLAGDSWRSLTRRRRHHRCFVAAGSSPVVSGVSSVSKVLNVSVVSSVADIGEVEPEKVKETVRSIVQGLADGIYGAVVVDPFRGENLEAEAGRTISESVTVDSSLADALPDDLPSSGLSAPLSGIFRGFQEQTDSLLDALSGGSAADPSPSAASLPSPLPPAPLGPPSAEGAEALVYQGLNFLQTALGDSAVPPEVGEAGNVVVAFLGDSAGEFFAQPEEVQWRVAGLGLALWLYLTARPGFLGALADMYIFTPLQVAWGFLLGRYSYKRTDFVLGQRLGEGNFGTVYEGALLPRGMSAEATFGNRSLRLEDLEGRVPQLQKVVLKKVKIGVEGAEECGEMEEWFNRRMMRLAPETSAKFLGSFLAKDTRGQFTEGGRWLVWKYEGNTTLADYMRDRSFPDNLEFPLFGRALLSKEPDERRLIIIKHVMRQIVSALKKMHETGLVHRDVKPANLVVTAGGDIRFIDFGAAVDLRVGKNYVPTRGMLDPDYCPPEQFVLPANTPEPPPGPVAAAFSPLLWQTLHPDLFDMFSVGIILLQLSCSQLRTVGGLQTFRSELAKAGFDLERWRRDVRYRVNFELLDMENGWGWDLATKLIRQRNVIKMGRLSADAALRHPYFLFSLDQVAAVWGRVVLSR